jgi:hypothetical protein
MGQMPDEPNNDEFMNASAEEWSKPEEPAPMPERQPDETNRWGATQPETPDSATPNRWGSEPMESSHPEVAGPEKKGNSKWWVILIVVVVLLCLCVCAVVFGLPLLGLNLLPANFLQ